MEAERTFYRGRPIGPQMPPATGLGRVGLKWLLALPHAVSLAFWLAPHDWPEHVRIQGAVSTWVGIAGATLAFTFLMGAALDWRGYTVRWPRWLALLELLGVCLVYGRLWLDPSGEEYPQLIVGELFMLQLLILGAISTDLLIRMVRLHFRFEEREIDQIEGPPISRDPEG
jgi:hypothetical protein